MPERIGSIGNTQGVNESSKPNPKKLRIRECKLRELRPKASFEGLGLDPEYVLTCNNFVIGG
tara:strand:- start:6 stop:191 length:186 start_codon:yes stop_codon:yes gene_type:complete